MAGTNATAPPPPFTTPMLTGASITMGDPAIQADPKAPNPWTDSGLLTMPWMMFFTWLWAAITTAGVVAGAVIERFTLTVASTTITPATPASIGVWLVVKITQDATGGRTIAWGTNVKGAATNIDPTALTVSWFTFLGDTDPADSVVKWFATERPITGQAP